MATTVHEPPTIEIDRLPSHGSGNGGWRNLVPADGDLRRVKDSSPPPASTGIWVGLAAITMSFAAFTSALIVRQGASSDWHHFTLPPVLYLNTLVIVASSVTLEIARHRIAAFMGTPLPGIRTRHQRKLLLLLCADCSSCPPRVWRARRSGPRDRQTE
jgi:hypothetical protein